MPESRCTRTPATRTTQRRSRRWSSTSLNTVDPLHATNFPDTPYTGIQYVQIQEFQDLGTKCTQEFAAAISGAESTDDAIAKCQKLAEDVAVSGGYK